MSDEARNELSPEGIAKLTAVDSYLEEAIRDGRPLEALIATRRLGEILSARTKEAARVATDGPWSWADVGSALGMSKQAAHEKLHARVQGHLDEARAKLEGAEKASHSKIARRASRERERLEGVSGLHPKVESAKQRIDEWEQRQHDEISRNVKKGREEITRAEHSVDEKLQGSS
jgi:hypothetical protein